MKLVMLLIGFLIGYHYSKPHMTLEDSFYAAFGRGYIKGSK